MSEDIEMNEWLASLEDIIQQEGLGRARDILLKLSQKGQEAGLDIPFSFNTPYINTIPKNKQPPYPGDQPIEWRIRCLIRWNAMAMVVRANREEEGIGGHISTYASAATLLEVAFNHFLRGKENGSGDLVYFQGHASPGIYARAFLEGRISEEQLKNFRRELRGKGGLSSYPHPRLMPNFWEFPTVSMGLSPLMAIYQARFNRYLEDRGLKEKSDQKVWAFLGDGEMDEPEALGSITLAAREKLDNLIFVVNCNLQRLDGPVRGNGKIIQELEAVFRGAQWNVIKVIWGGDWDPLLEADSEGVLIKRMGEACDGHYQRYSVESGAYTRADFFGTDLRLKNLVDHLTDDQIRKLRRGGHEPDKVYSAYKSAVDHHGSPTVILAKTIKGYGLGESGEGKNITHQQKKLNEEELKKFRDRFKISLSDKEVGSAPFFKPSPDSPEIKYLLQRRKELGGFLPQRVCRSQPVSPPKDNLFEEFFAGADGREVSTTMVFVRLLSKLLRDPVWGPLVVPIVSDEARTFGMEALFRQCGIYAHEGQKYEPVDIHHLLYYREAKEGQILEEGITEAGSMASFCSAGSAYATHGIPTLPFFIFYSMFGFQRIGDLIWAACDQRCRGFLLGATSGRTTLAGEGLQHQDGHSHLLALAYPSIKAYDPSFAYELAVIIRQGMDEMHHKGEDLIYYITLGNQNYAMPAIPSLILANDRSVHHESDIDKIKEGIIKGLYLFSKSSISTKKGRAKVHIFGSGAIMTEVIKARDILEKDHRVACNIWSLTSFKALYDEGVEVEKWNQVHPETPKKTFVAKCLEKEEGVFVIASDYIRALPSSIARWFPKTPVILGTDGFGFSESRSSLRSYFKVDAGHIVSATLAAIDLK